MGIKEEVFTILMEDRDAEKAINILLSKYSNPTEQCIAVYSSWSRVRQFILSNETCRNKYYIEKVKALMDTMDASTDTDHYLLECLLSCSLRQQHRVYISKTRYLKNPENDKILKDIKPIKIPFYSFNLPDYIIQARNTILENRSKEDQKHNRKPKEEYIFRLDDAKSILDKARALVENPPVIKTKVDCYLLVNACQILSGRRNFEIVKSLVYQPASHPWQAMVSGICKKEIAQEFDYVCRVIPLLCEYTKWERAMNAIRSNLDLPDTPSLVNSKIGGKILDCSKRLFGRRLTHTQKRNLYSELSYLNRHEENEFLINEESCSKAVWVAMALCHSDPGAPSTTQRYLAMEIQS